MTGPSGIAAIEAACEAALPRTGGEFSIFVRVGNADQAIRSTRYHVSWKRDWRDDLQYITSSDNAHAVIVAVEAWTPPDAAEIERRAAERELLHAAQRARKAGIDPAAMLKDALITPGYWTGLP